MKKIYISIFVFAMANYLYAQTKTAPPVSRSQVPAKNAVTLKVKPAVSGSTSFINGSFEFNTGFCIINGSNDQITSNVVATTAYGCADEIDLMSNDCGYGTALSGNFFLCLANGQLTCPDACTMELTANLVAGNTYTISYYDRGYDVNGCCPPGVPLEVGVSANANAQGTVVYTSPVPTTNKWTKRVFSFTAPVSGKYISFQAKYGVERWTHIDSVVIEDASVCGSPFDLNVSGVQSTCAKLTWSTPEGTFKNYKIFYRVKGTTSVWHERKAATETQIRLSDLYPNTTYEWSMRTVCDDSTKSALVTGPDFATLPDNTIMNNVKVFPNPLKNIMQIDGLSATVKTKLTLLDFMGNAVLTANVTSKTFNWNISSLNPGNYLLKIETNTATSSRWVVKQ